MFGAAGPWQILILLVIILLLFGKRIPGMMGSLGQGVVEFKKGLNSGDEDTERKSSKENKSESEE